MMVNLIKSAPWSVGEMRSLLFRQIVYACIAIMMVLGAVVFVRLILARYTPHNQPQHAVSSEVLSKCHSDLERLERFNLLQSESDRSRGRPGQALHIVEGAIPSDLWLTELVVSEARIDVVGMSRSESAVSTFVEAVATSGAVRDLRLESSRVISDGGPDMREFHISGNLAERESGVHE
jgi:Tfp pilus assembly protein PilN